MDERGRAVPAENFPQCRWVSITAAHGRRRLEMRWHVPVVPVRQQAAEPVAAQAEAVALAA